MKKLQLLIIALFLGFVLINCNSKSDQAQSNSIQAPNDTLMAKGFVLMESNCFSCHSPNPVMENKVAPSIFDIKMAYLAEDGTKKQLVSDLSLFLGNSEKKIIKMPEALQEYGPMPIMNYSDKDINAIAAYLFHTPLETKNWFEKAYPKEAKKYEALQEAPNYLALGKEMAMKTKGVLGKNLLHAIKTKGTEHAVSFCSTKAYPLTDSMATSLNASIKRVSDQNRNPNNEAKGAALEYIQAAKLALQNGEKINPKIIHINGQIEAFYPIMTNNMCLQCHGSVEQDITSKTYAKIKSLYPDDKAVNYGPNELRGIWVVSMKESQ